ncbi:MAG: hypothetical protein QOG28_2640 [Trebonia sp.]|jgi:hypothetical protein|nr:hypothetical protein [Trebonia sp.]
MARAVRAVRWRAALRLLASHGGRDFTEGNEHT